MFDGHPSSDCTNAAPCAAVLHRCYMRYACLKAVKHSFLIHDIDGQTFCEHFVELQPATAGRKIVMHGR